MSSKLSTSSADRLSSELSIRAENSNTVDTVSDVKINAYLCNYIHSYKHCSNTPCSNNAITCNAYSASIDTFTCEDDADSEHSSDHAEIASAFVESRLELDSHANMHIVGKAAYIISESGETAEVNAYKPDYSPREIPIVDEALKFESPYDGKTYMLVIRHALYVPSMTNSLTPPFM